MIFISVLILSFLLIRITSSDIGEDKVFVNNRHGGKRARRRMKNKKKGIIIIPGLGREDRIDIVKNNIEVLKRGNHLALKSTEVNVDINEDRNHFKWDCVVYIYASHDDLTFWNKKADIEYIRTYCEIIENPKGRITQNLYLAQPFWLKNEYEYVFILLDDCKLDYNHFDLSKMMNIMTINSLTVASARIINANKGGGQQFRLIMQAEPIKGTEGYVTSFIEFFACIMTIPAYNALWELLYPDVNPYGWGYDFWYDNYAKSKVYGHKMGIISSISITHIQGIEGRSENAKTDVIWKAVLAQEAVYKSHYNIDLNNHRKNMHLKNTSLTGAVLGYLYPQIGF